MREPAPPDRHSRYRRRCHLNRRRRSESPIPGHRIYRFDTDRGRLTTPQPLGRDASQIRDMRQETKLDEPDARPGRAPDDGDRAPGGPAGHDRTDRGRVRADRTGHRIAVRQAAGQPLVPDRRLRRTVRWPCAAAALPRRSRPSPPRMLSRRCPWPGSRRRLLIPEYGRPPWSSRAPHATVRQKRRFPARASPGETPPRPGQPPGPATSPARPAPRPGQPAPAVTNPRPARPRSAQTARSTPAPS